MSDTTEKRDVSQIVTDKIIAALESGTVPWKKTWSEAGIPRNFITRKPYRGINALLLALQDYPQSYYLTLRQLNGIGGKIRKGEKSHLIVYWNWKEVEDQETKEMIKLPYLRYYLVWNIAQCNAIPAHLMPEQMRCDYNPIPTCEALIAGMPNPPDIIHKMDTPLYNHIDDYINMPRMEQFTSPEAYYRVLFHELIHSTGHSSRLNRKELMEGQHNADAYSFEELTAEIGACYLSSHAGIAADSLPNSAAYIKGWLDKLRSDRKFILYASGRAQRAVNYILDRREITTPEEGDVLEDLEL